MKWFRKSSRRRAVTGDSTEAMRRFRIGRCGWHAILIVLVFVLGATFIISGPFKNTPYILNKRVRSDILAPTAFTMQNPRALQRLRRLAMEQTPAVLLLNRHDHFYSLVKSQLSSLPYDVTQATDPQSISPVVARRFPGLSADALNYLHSLVSGNQIPAYNNDVHLLFEQLKRYPVVDAASWRAIKRHPGRRVWLAAVPSPTGAMRSARRYQIKHFGPKSGPVFRKPVMRCFPQVLWQPVVAYLTGLRQPTYRFDPRLTHLLENRNAANVRAPVTRFEKGQMLARRNTRITPALQAELIAARAAYVKKRAMEHPWGSLLSRAGEGLAVLIITIAGAMYSSTYLRRFAGGISRGWTLALFLLCMLFVAALSAKTGTAHMMFFIGTLPALLAAIILVIAYEPRFALGVSAINALLITFALGRGIDFLLIMMAGIVVLVFGLREIRTRGKLIRMGTLAGLAMAVTVLALGLAQGTASHTLVLHALWMAQRHSMHALFLNSVAAGSSALAAAGVALIFLPAIERAFKITTAMALLELCDTNQPLLRRLAVEAPGTYNHSLVLGIMAEGAAQAIGANGLLCRVGAYYHDIGKLTKPSYFIENQGGGPNRHLKLSPAMSLLIIVAHVKDGSEMAGAYRLPWSVHQFIEQHHGTTVVEYFFRAARQRQAKDALTHGDTPEVSEADFRYPGPRPQTRESAIVMICDGVEATVRAMGEPTAGRIETVVHETAMRRLMDGQFAECDLTLRELSLIEQSIARTLAGVYHGRVAYPKPLQISQPA